ncbi:MAG: ABC transporter ATP-binding protein [Vulcanimicrobiota bacterium]
MEKALFTENLVKTYKSKVKKEKREVQALKNLNMEVKVGDIYGFIGPNGAGKTTTIKILMGLIEATDGKAWIMNKPAGTVEAKKNVGYLSEVAYYYPFMEVGKLLDFYCSFYEIPKSERKEKILNVLKMVNLSNKIDAKIKELSKGMMQRFGIAQAIIADPPVMIFDELTSGLDPIAQKEVKDIVLKLKEQGKTIFFSSHQMTEVAMICDKIGIINQGRMLKSANLDQFLKEESGSKTKIVVETNQDKLKFLKEKNVDLENERTGVFSFLIPDEDVGEVVDKLVSEKAKVEKVEPHRYSLEDAFFKLVKEDKNEL